MVEKLTAKDLAEIRENFSLFDKNSDGTITAHEIGTVLRSLNMHPTEKDIKNMIREVDKDGNGSIEFPEFLEMMAKQKQNDMGLNEEDIVTAFRMFDKDNNGKISAQELREIMSNLGEALSQTELEAMLHEADINGDGEIDYKEFTKIMCSQIGLSRPVSKSTQQQVTRQTTGATAAITVATVNQSNSNI
ncbi:uncharacterized protein LOC141910137 isoform X2 [Tubulanus polymorphus]|uniref:uncharacterized protein LOC141910137 isoform X2 n=1 Tax=Tubulanus polymorphus TaxID=672921 RepID=UPI003DA41BC9